MIGRTLSHYRILEPIGAGGMGVVYRARDLRLERDVALKMLPQGVLADDTARKRFRREALALSRLNHPAVESVYDFDSHEGLDFLVMELVPGESLARHLARGPLSDADALRLGIQIVEGIEAAHEQGVIHRDLKPDNIVVTPKGQVKLLDFGIAKLLASPERPAVHTTTTEVGDMVGTPRYLAPEILLGSPADPRTDLYAFGVVLYEACAGRPPFDAPVTTALIGQILHTPAPPLATLKPDISPALERLIHRCLEKDPTARPSTAQVLLDDLRALAAGEAVPQRVDPGVPQKEPLPQRRSRLLVVTVFACVAVAALILAVAGRHKLMQALGGSGRIQSLAVLPLANLSNDPEQEYFADGMTEELISEIAQVTSLRVISRTSVMAFKGSDRSLPEIARKLRVDAVVEGSVRTQGGRVRVTAQLIRASDDRHLWSQTYDRRIEDLLNLQTEVAAAITAEIRAVLLPGERARLARSRTVNPAAHEAYLRGRYLWNRRTQATLDQAIDEFRRAIALDSTFAPAYSGLASAYAVLPVYRMVPMDSMMVLARAAAERAVALDAGLSEPHAVIASGLSYEFRRAEAEHEFRRAIALNPNDVPARQWYGEFLLQNRRFQEAFAELGRARDLDPLSLIVASVESNAYWHAGQPDRAIAKFREVVAMDTTFARAHMQLGLALQTTGHLEQAFDQFEIADLLNGRDLDETRTTYAQLREAYRTGGREGYWKKTLGLRLQRVREGRLRPSVVAIAYAQLGRNDEAFEWLERAIREGDPELQWFQTTPFLEPLHADPRFEAIRRRLGFGADSPRDG